MDRIETLRHRLGELRQRRLTVPEAAIVFDTTPADLRHAVSRGMIEASNVKRGGRSYRMLTAEAVMQWVLVRPFGQAPVDCRKAVAASLNDTRTWAIVGDHISIRIKTGADSVVPGYAVHLDEVLPRITERLDALDDLDNQIEIGSTGEPVIRGTDIPVYRVAALLQGGSSPAEVVRDFPSLDPNQVRAAEAYAAVHPKQGRPYPSGSVKAALRAGRGGLRRALAAADE